MPDSQVHIAGLPINKIKTLRILGVLVCHDGARTALLHQLQTTTTRGFAESAAHGPKEDDTCKLVQATQYTNLYDNPLLLAM